MGRSTFLVYPTSSILGSSVDVFKGLQPCYTLFHDLANRQLMRNLNRLLIVAVVGILILWSVVASHQTPPAVLATFAPTQITPAAFTINQCVKVTRPTNLRFGPGIDYPVFTNIPARPQPPMTIIDNPIIGLTCSDVSNCQPYVEDWWWPVQLIWPDTGDIDRGWLSQSDLKPCA